MNEEKIEKIEKVEVCCESNGWKDKKHYKKCGSMGCIYGLGFIGAAVFFIQNAETFWIGVLGILKALVWPALLIYKLFVSLGI